MLASSFNFQGKVKKTFFVLTDDKVGSGPRLRPGVLSQPVNSVEPMDTDHSETTSSPKQSTSKAQPTSLPTSLSAKLAALKRKASDQPDSGAGKQTKQTKNWANEKDILLP